MDNNCTKSNTDEQKRDETMLNADPTKPTAPLKLVSWNINGIRTINIQEILKEFNASILMVQETKLSRTQLDQSQIIPPGYSSYFSFSTNRVGYSGVATYCKDEWMPSKAENGLCFRNPAITDNVGCYPEVSEDMEKHVKFANSDGRTVITQHVIQLPDGTERPLTFINVYCPRLRDDPEDPINNTDFKRTFHRILHRRAQLFVESGSFVIVAGDMNISHRYIDHCEGDPKTFVTNEFRQLLDDFLSDKANCFVDSFRMFYPDKTSAFTCWNTKLNARENNYGTRIDYVFVDKELSSYLQEADIHPDIMGSDHCPISVSFHSLKPLIRTVPPSFATKFYQEFKDKQKNMKEFLQSSSKSQVLETKIWQSKMPQSAINPKKRPLDASTRIQSSKRIQSNLDSFFRKTTCSELLTETKSEMCTDGSTSFKCLQENQNFSQSESSEMWKKLMKAPEMPLCQGHKMPCVKRTVKKKGVNFGREFWSCSRGIGKTDDPNANCNFFQWLRPTISKYSK